MSPPRGPRRPPIVPDRVRRIDGGFCSVLEASSQPQSRPPKLAKRR
jgi:hypothetical protein